MSKKPKLCKYCKEELNKGATVCSKCGKKQGLTCGEALVAVIVIIIGFSVFLKACSGINEGYENASENASVSSEAEKMSEDEYKDKCRAVSFEEIARDKKALDGEKVTFTGEIIQAMDNTYRLNVTKDEFGYTDTIIFEFDSDKLEENILEGDIVTIWGESKGFITYESIVGAEITAPEIRAVYIENNGKAEK